MSIDPKALALPTQPVVSGVSLQRPRLLLVSAAADCQRMLRHLLEPHYSLECLDDGEAALEVMRQRQPDLLLAELALPGSVDGVGLLRALRANPSTRTTPVLLFADDQGCEQSLEAGADDCLAYSSSPRQLLARVAKLVELAHLRREAASARRAAEYAQLQQASEQRFHQMLDTMLEGCQIIGFDWRYLYLNDSVIRHSRRSREELLGHTLLEAYPGIEYTTVFAAMKRCMEARIPHQMQNRFEYADGSSAWFDLSIQPAPEGIFVLSIDITERKQAEQALRKSEKQYRLLADGVADVVWVLDAQSMRFKYVSPSVQRLRGFTVEEVLAQSIDQVIMPDSLAWIKAAFPERIQQFLAGDPNAVTQLHEVKQSHKDGSTVWTEVASTLVWNEYAELEVIGISRNISQRKQAEAALLRSERVLKLFVEHAPAAIAMLDRDLVYIATSRRFLTDYRITQSRIVGYSHYEIFPEISERWRTIHQRCLAGESAFSDEDPFPRTDGTLDWVRWKIHPWYESENEIGGLILFSEVITERKRLEAQMLQAQKMESVGQLAGGVAHDFNNLLTVIGGYADLVLANLPASSPIHDDIEEIVKATNLAATLTRQLLAFARKQVIEPQLLNLNEQIKAMENLLRRLLGEAVELVTLLTPDPGQVKADPGQFEQVLINLTVNARDAMPTGGTFTITTRIVELDASCARQRVGVVPGMYVLVAVSDTGIGMDATIQQHVFEPFFTTKPPGHGTGLGLATCFGIIKQHGGNIWVESEPGQGTTFSIYLPLVEAETEQPLEAPPLPSPFARR